MTGNLRPNLRGGRINWVPYLFVLPALLIHIILVSGPALSTLVMSFYEWNGLGNPVFIGWQNFQEIFRDKIVSIAIRNNLKWMAIFITVPIILAVHGFHDHCPDPQGADVLPHGLLCSLCDFRRRGRQDLVGLLQSVLRHQLDL